MNRIIIVSGIQLSANPRVVKEADALAAAGYDVTVVGATLDASLVERDHQLYAGKSWRYEVVLDASSASLSRRTRWLRARVERRFWREMRQRFRLPNYHQLGYGPRELLDYCTRHPADLFILHNPLSLWVGARLMQTGARVAVDVEDWYSEDLLPSDRAGVPTELLSSLEREVLRRAAFSTTTSNAMGAALADVYGCARPVVIYNAFPALHAAVDDTQLSSPTSHAPSLVWFSQVIGPGRGIETLMSSLQHVHTPIDIHLRGTYDNAFASALLEHAPHGWRERIHFHPQIPHDQLAPWIAQHDIGFAGEIGYCRSRDLTVSNKILQYLGAGIPVLASNTTGHTEIAETAGEAVRLFEAGDSSSLARALNEMLRDQELLASLRRKAAQASNTFSWDESARRLVGNVAAAVQRTNGA